MSGTSLVWKVQQACPSATKKAMSINILYRKTIYWKFINVTDLEGNRGAL